MKFRRSKNQKKFKKKKIKVWSQRMNKMTIKITNKAMFCWLKNCLNTLLKKCW